MHVNYDTRAAVIIHDFSELMNSFRGPVREQHSGARSMQHLSQ
jgi:hypothetical protein